MPNTKKRIKFGWCVTDHHDRCTGALRRPRDENDNEQLVLCNCRCHHGQEVAPPVEIVRVQSERERMQAEMDEWWSQLVIHGHIEIDASEDERSFLQYRFRKAAADDKSVQIMTRYTGGQVCVKVK